MTLDPHSTSKGPISVSTGEETGTEATPAFALLVLALADWLGASDLEPGFSPSGAWGLGARSHARGSRDTHTRAQ